jgi:hypothetical protein
MALASAPASGQNSVFLTVETNWPDAIVFADSVPVGLAGQYHFVLSEPVHQVRLVPPASNVWNVVPLSATVNAQPGDSVRVELTFPYTYQVESLPFGAEVFLETEAGRRRLGTTPVQYRSAQPVEGTFVIERSGYARQRVEPGRDVLNRTVLTLEPLVAVETHSPTVNWRPPRRSTKWIDYAAVGLAATAGVATVHYKFRADRAYDRYLQTGDPALRDVVNRNDLRAAVALGAMQVGVGVFTLRLVFR